MSEDIKGDAFVEHLEQLSVHFGHDWSEVPTSDQIIKGLRYPKPDLEIQIGYALINSCTWALRDLAEKYDFKFNIVVQEAVDNYCIWLETVSAELQTLALSMLLRQLKLTDRTKFTDLLATLVAANEEIVGQTYFKID